MTWHHQPPLDDDPMAFVMVALEPVGGPAADMPGKVIPVPTDFLLDQGQLPGQVFLANDVTSVGAIYDRDEADDRTRYTIRPDGTHGWLVCARYRYRAGSDRIGMPDGPPL